jgi:hypothetical protein
VTSQAIEGNATLGLDHFDRAPAKPRIEIGHHHLGAGARQQDRRSPAVADTVARSTPPLTIATLPAKPSPSRSSMRAFVNCLPTVSADKKCPKPKRQPNSSKHGALMLA